MDRGGWWATVGRVTELDLTEQITHTHTHTHTQTQDCWECVQSTWNSKCSVSNNMIIAVQLAFKPETKLGFLVLLTFRRWMGETIGPSGIFLDSFPAPEAAAGLPAVWGMASR